MIIVKRKAKQNQLSMTLAIFFSFEISVAFGRKWNAKNKIDFSNDTKWTTANIKKRQQIYFHSKCDLIWLTDRDERRTKKLITWNDPSNYSSRTYVALLYIYQFSLLCSECHKFKHRQMYVYTCRTFIIWYMCLAHTNVRDALIWLVSAEESKSRCFNGRNKNALWTINNERLYTK